MPVHTAKPAMTRARAVFIRLLDLYRLMDYRLSLLEVQKLTYFMQEAGEPLRLRFVKAPYGPYADNLNHALQRIEGHYIRGYGDRSHSAQLRLLPPASNEAQDFLEGSADVEDRLRRVADLIEGFETPYGMELLASVHWVACHEDRRAAEDPSVAVDGVQAWSKRKRERFLPPHIRTAWDRLHGQGWLDAPASQQG